MTFPHHASGVRSVIGVDAGTVTLREADHLVHRVLGELALTEGVFACTHLYRTDERRGTTISLTLPDADAVWPELLKALPEGAGLVLGGRTHGPAGMVDAAGLAAAAPPRSGRAVAYPGVAHLTGTVTVADLLDRTAIEHLVVLGAPAAELPSATEVLTQDHVRPEWRDGVLVLVLVPAAGGLLAPFEVPDPTPCCVDHP
ncbi:hypothetical protein [Streptomyces fuscichromogenes]|uniref:Uncharacterized protein n=1 Tax=Streptomyces fuscichromogenes TaxID=1324013 RepID=A0A918CRX0_9ACTN|nr:hypothetical protein [Streptomyces fuscichromogenes]GGN11551.1 hypothetical protein GCM10011578_037930 [Streptomyces fuscichromogenes]